MKTRYLALSLAAMATLGMLAGSPKRGVSENQFSYLVQMRALEPGVCWYYNWGNSGAVGSKGEIAAAENTMEFVPMCWGNYNADAIREYVKNHPETKYLLGFNEPNFKTQSNMTPAVAAERWPEVQALAKELNLKLVAPALNYSPDAPYTDPTRWMDEFVALVGEDAFDYTAVHSYGGAEVMKELATKFHDRYGKDVWVTEFCFWPGEMGYVNPKAQISSMVDALEWLEQTPWIFRYAWFKAVGSSDSPTGPNYGLLKTMTSLESCELSEQGKVYTYLPDFDTERYHAVGETFPAVDYVARQFAGVGAGSNPDCEVPIEISEFVTGATLDYQFDVTESGDYYLALNVSGVGEPTRFDPTLAVYSVGADGELGECLMPAAKFTLSGSDTEYRRLLLPVTLQAGRQRLRLVDANSYSPSGIRISEVMLGSQTGVAVIEGSATAVADVYSIDGLCVRRAADAMSPLEGLPAGLYIVNGKKILKSK